MSTLNSSFGDLLYNAFTGDLDSSQVNQLTSNETANLVAAGADPTAAAAQAQNDVDTTLATFTGTGGLGLSWTGAATGAGPFAGIANSLTTNWKLWLLGGVAVLGFLAFAYGGFGIGRR